MTVSQTGGLAPVLPALIAAAPLIAKTIGLAGLGSLTSYGVQKSITSLMEHILRLIFSY